MKDLLNLSLFFALVVFGCVALLVLSPNHTEKDADQLRIRPLKEQVESHLLPLRTRLIEHELVHEGNGVMDFCVSPDATREEILTLAFTLRDDLEAQCPKKSIVLRIHKSKDGLEPYDLAAFNASSLCSVHYIRDLDRYRVQWGF